MEPAQASLLAVAMNRLWLQYLPELEGRVAVLQAAATALGEGSLTNELREQAHAAAHKLAGVLGTFGLADGTELAREAENFYSCNDNVATARNERMAQIPAHLRDLLAARK